MEKLGEIMKSCENCKYSTEHYTGCSECVEQGIHINWKPVEAFKPLPMEEIKVEDYEVITQVDGLVKLMTKVDEVSLDNPEHPANQELLPELDAFNLEQIQNYNNTILKQVAKPHGRTHYYKFTLDFCEGYSIRFFLEFSDRKDYEQNWYLKSHKLKEHTLLTKEMAEDLIRKSCTTFVEEIIGRRSGKKYEKIVVSKDKLVKFIE